MSVLTQGIFKPTKHVSEAEYRRIQAEMVSFLSAINTQLANIKVPNVFPGRQNAEQEFVNEHIKALEAVKAALAAGPQVSAQKSTGEAPQKANPYRYAEHLAQQTRRVLDVYNTLVMHPIVAHKEHQSLFDSFLDLFTKAADFFRYRLGKECQGSFYQTQTQGELRKSLSSVLNLVESAKTSCATQVRQAGTLQRVDADLGTHQLCDIGWRQAGPQR